ncbi:MAG: hypothetical protein V7L14_17785 [Nostoc sp.]|uniref:hypothetical protein n=1 Tax=Nostoc sp. TaxID=1180 RepID=UPI002FFCAED3
MRQALPMSGKGNTRGRANQHFITCKYLPAPVGDRSSLLWVLHWEQNFKQNYGIEITSLEVIIVKTQTDTVY